MIEKTGLVAILYNRYSIYADGCVYDGKGKDIPNFIFEIRDILIKKRIKDGNIFY